MEALLARLDDFVVPPPVLPIAGLDEPGEAAGGEDGGGAAAAGGTGTDGTAASTAASAADGEDGTDEQATPLDWSTEMSDAQRATLERVYKEGIGADITFKVGNEVVSVKSFHLSRSLMSAISPVFKAMLFGPLSLLQQLQQQDQPQPESKEHESLDDNSEDKEKTAMLKVINIPDIPPSAFECIVRYAYCCDPKITPRTAVAVKYACEKYAIQGLSEACDIYLESVLGPPNICVFLDNIYRYRIDNSVKRKVDDDDDSGSSKKKKTSKKDESEDDDALDSKKWKTLDWSEKIKNGTRMFTDDLLTVVASKSFRKMNPLAMRFFLGSNFVGIPEDTIWKNVRLWAEYQSKHCSLLQFAIYKYAIDREDGKVSEDEAMQQLRVAFEISAKMKESTAKSSSSLSSTSPSSSSSVTDKSCSQSDDSAIADGKDAQGSVSDQTGKIDDEDEKAVPISSDGDGKDTTAIVDVTSEEAKTEKEETDKEGSSLEEKSLEPVDFLKLIYRKMRFGLMNPKYFLSEVCSVEGLLSEWEKKRILIHSHCKELSCAPFSVVARKIDLNAKRICIERGSTSSGPSWYYNDPIDAISFICSKNVALEGFGIFGGTGTITATAKLFIGDNDSNPSRCGEQIGMAEGEWQQTVANREPNEFKFRKRIMLKKGVKYTLQLHQRTSNGDQAYRVTNGQSSVSVDDLTIEFSSACHSPNCTSVSAGAFPCLWMYRRD